MISFLYITCVIVLGFTALLILDVGAIRLLRSYRTHQISAFINKWTPQIQPYLLSGVGRKPSISSATTIDWLILWVSLGLSSNGDALDKLAALGKELGLLDVALEHLRGRSYENKLIALSAIGFLNDTSPWSLIVPVSYSSNLSLSLRAIEALVRLDSSRAIPFILEHVPQRQDWPTNIMMELMGDISPTLISEYVRQAMENADPKTIPALIPFLELLPTKERSVLFLKYMTNSALPETLIAFLKIAAHPKEIALVRDYISHGDWHVRGEAATALGRAGNLLDKALLEPLLCDPVWWVRHDSAQALFLLPDIKPKALREIQMLHPDLFIKEER